MKKPLLFSLVLGSLLFPLSAHTAFDPAEGFSPITWVGARGITSYMRAPLNIGYIDYITVIDLTKTQVKLVSSGVPRTSTGPAVAPFPTSTAENWLFTRAMVEQFKAQNPEVKFVWDMPFFSITIPRCLPYLPYPKRNYPTVYP